jgi:hypothetical protein
MENDPKEEVGKIQAVEYWIRGTMFCGAFVVVNVEGINAV